ncbi:MAG: GIY-YIG nuclease family protein [Patescibacteria group bacterium]
MYYVYLLKDAQGRNYIGSTNNLQRRLAEHAQGQTQTTRHMDKPELVYYEAYNNEALARVREQKLKAYGSALQALKKRLAIA